MTVFFFFTVSHKGSISPFKKHGRGCFVLIRLPMSDIQLPPMSDIQLPMLSNIRLPPNVRHSTADVVKHSVAANVRHSAAVECQAVLPFFTRDQIYPPIPIAANSHTPRTSVMKYFRNSASRSSSGITDMLSKIVNP